VNSDGREEIFGFVILCKEEIKILNELVANVPLAEKMLKLARSCILATYLLNISLMYDQGVFQHNDNTIDNEYNSNDNAIENDNADSDDKKDEN